MEIWATIWDLLVIEEKELCKNQWRSGKKFPFNKLKRKKDTRYSFAANFP